MDHPPRTRPRTNVDRDVQWSLLPEEVMEQVHLWLPVKSILKFKCVCKSWLARFSSLDFIYTHLECSKRRNDLGSLRLVFEPQSFDFMQSCSLSSVFDEHVALATTELDYPMEEKSLDSIIGTCNGLLCAKCTIEKDSLIVLNPSTRVFRELPLQEVWEDEYEAEPDVLGFGYDQSSDDYKVVAIAYDVFGVFSMKKNSWRAMDFEIDCNIDNCDLCCFLDGTLNWAVDLANGTNDSWVVLSFDLASEEFQMLSLPQFPQFDAKSGPVIGVMAGCLCVLSHRVDQNNDMWVMKEYGVASSWTLVTSIPDPHGELDCVLTPICIFKDIILVLEGAKEKLILFDLKKKSFYYPQIHGLHRCHEVQLYVESLVSPFGNGRKCDESQKEN